MLGEGAELTLASTRSGPGVRETFVFARSPEWRLLPDAAAAAELSAEDLQIAQNSAGNLASVSIKEMPMRASVRSAPNVAIRHDLAEKSGHGVQVQFMFSK
jgi:hypothetical protein